MIIEATSPNLITYHLHGLPFEEGAECIVSETASDFIISSGEKRITITKESIFEVYVEIETKRVQTDEVDVLNTIIQTTVFGIGAPLLSEKPIKKMQKIEYENLVILYYIQGKGAKISLRIPVESWEKAEELASNFHRNKTNGMEDL